MRAILNSEQGDPPRRRAKARRAAVNAAQVHKLPHPKGLQLRAALDKPSRSCNHDSFQFFNSLLITACLTASLLCAAGLTGSPVHPLPESAFPELGRVLNAARDHAPEYQIGRERLREAEGERMIGRSHQLPRVHLWSQIASAYEIRDDIDDRLRGTISGNINLTQPVWHWGATENLRRIHELYAEMIESESVETMENFLIRVSEHWLRWLLALHWTTTLEKHRSELAAQLRFERDLEADGQSTPERVLDIEIQLAEREEQLLRHQRDLERLEQQLTHWAGDTFDRSTGSSELERLRDFRIQNPPDPRQNPPDQWSPARRAAAEGRIAAEQAALHRTANWPKLNLVAGVSQDELDAINQTGSFYRWNAYLGVRVDWAIFDGHRSRGERLKALAQQRQADRRHELALAEFRQRRDQLHADLQLHERQTANREQRFAMAQRLVQLARDEADAGRQTTTDLGERIRQMHEREHEMLASKVSWIIHYMHWSHLTRIP